MLNHPGNNSTPEWGRWIQQFRTYERTDPLAKLLARVTHDPESGCWLVKVGGLKNGYPLVREGHSGWHYGHRLAYERLVGPIPAKHRLHHTCETPICVNPEHLTPQTARSHAHEHGLGVGPCAKCGAEDWYIRKDNGTRQCRECKRRRRASAKSAC